jgi:hypothetical protein
MIQTAARDKLILAGTLSDDGVITLGSRVHIHWDMNPASERSSCLTTSGGNNYPNLAPIREQIIKDEEKR